MDLSPARAALVADIEAVTTLRVTDNPKTTSPPCVLVGPIQTVEKGGACLWDVEVPVWVVSAAPGDARAVDQLAAHVAYVLGACGDADANLGTLDVGSGTLPAYEITARLVIKE